MPRTKRRFPHLGGPLPDAPVADDLAELFKVLANDNRLRILHAIHLAGGAERLDIATAIGVEPAGRVQPAAAPRRPAHRPLPAATASGCCTGSSTRACRG